MRLESLRAQRVTVSCWPPKPHLQGGASWPVLPQEDHGPPLGSSSHVTLNCLFTSHLTWWPLFVPSWNTVGSHFPLHTHMVGPRLNTDVSGILGVWHLVWPVLVSSPVARTLHTAAQHSQRDDSINLAAGLWGHHWAGHLSL